MENKDYVLNGQKVTKEEIENKKKELKEKKDIDLVQINESTYRTRLKG